jgi:hypothetical protein
MKTLKRKISEEEINFAFNSVGFQFPQTEKELKAFENLYSDYEYKINGHRVNVHSIIDTVKKEEGSQSNKKFKQTNKTYFKRVVLAAEIAKSLHNENTFGHVKFQKLMYLCEHACNMQLNDRYCKQAAGPYDSKFMHSIDFELKKQNWFEVKKDENAKSFRYKYTPLVGLSKQEIYYSRYFPCDENIKFIINLFKTSKTDFVELVATLYACILEINDIEIEESVLLDKLYSWSEEKRKFSVIQVRETLTWMKENSIYPK